MRCLASSIVDAVETQVFVSPLNSERTPKTWPAFMFAIMMAGMTSAIMFGLLVSSGTVTNAASGA